MIEEIYYLFLFLSSIFIIGIFLSILAILLKLNDTNCVENETEVKE
jgi:hypothetical protein